MQRIGVLGGMMDPIHTGHLHAAKAALNAGLDRVLLAPCLTPSHRAAPLAPPEDRMEMCRLAAADEAGLEVSDIELREGPCYASDTVRLLKKRYPGAQITWIMGSDKLPSLGRWYEADQLFALCDFYVCPRPGFDPYFPVPGAALRVLTEAEIKASSGDVIKMLHALSDAPGLLSRNVARYIALKGLYQPDYLPALTRYGMREKRIRHTLGVRQTAVELADRWGASMQAAGVAAMLHDIAKPLPLLQMQALSAQYGLDLPEELTQDGNLLHGPLAAAIAQRELGVTDAGVLSAIACHTTGKPGMSTLDKVLFIADAIEPSRADYPGLSDMRMLVKNDLDAAVLMSMRRTKEYVRSRGLPFCSHTEAAIRDLEKQKEETK
ncbi:MAG: bis(5'-nucleosyl)-tetraphosphatase (symmetrical) YqeK [Clostridia bacterium]|nr:bis(5'-nucleosyl)-tetraphosphatase (symmetrical) YqeK [Clostridia bacterium]